MDNLVFACVAPHGALVIPLISGPDGARARAGRAGMEELSRRMEAAQPETIVILETHSMLVDGAIALLDSARVHGELGAPHPVVPPEAPEHHFSLTFDVDRELNAAIVAAARASNVPVVRVRHFLEATPLKIEWGSLIPLWYLGATIMPQPKVVIADVAFPRNQVSREAYIDFGRALRTVIAAAGKRIAVIISTDLAHTHAADGRYGFDPAAAECDAALLERAPHHRAGLASFRHMPYHRPMSDTQPVRPIRPRRQAVDGVCVDCGRDTPAAEVARVLRITSDGRGRVVCNDCSARIHAAKRPAPIPLQRPVHRPPEPDHS